MVSLFFFIIQCYRFFFDGRESQGFNFVWRQRDVLRSQSPCLLGYKTLARSLGANQLFSPDSGLCRFKLACHWGSVLSKKSPSVPETNLEKRAKKMTCRSLEAIFPRRPRHFHRLRAFKAFHYCQFNFPPQDGFRLSVNFVCNVCRRS